MLCHPLYKPSFVTNVEKEKIMAKKTLVKLDNGLWLGIWTEYHSGAEGKANATLRMLKELEYMIDGLCSQARNTGGHLSTDVEDFKQNLCLVLIELLSTYDPSKGKFSTYAHHELNSRLSDYRRGGTGAKDAPLTHYQVKKGGFVHFDSYEQLNESEESRALLHKCGCAPSAEDEFFNSQIPEDMLEFREYVDSLSLSPKEKREKWRLFVGLRDLRF